MKIHTTVTQSENNAINEALERLEETSGIIPGIPRDSALHKVLQKVSKAVQASKAARPPIYLKRMTWYVAEVSFRGGNPIHRCVAFHRGNGHVELIGSYDLDDMPMRSRISELAYFKPIREIPELEPGEIPFQLPKEAPTIIYIED